jgi:GDPmannose 4,6-dehydratase
LGNLEAKRDWGFAGDYVQAMWKMLQQDKAEDYVVGTGIAHSVREFCQIAFDALDLDYQDYVIEDPSFYRPVERVQLVADPSYAKSKLGWEPEVDFEGLVRMMVAADMEALA